MINRVGDGDGEGLRLLRALPIARHDGEGMAGGRLIVQLGAALHRDRSVHGVDPEAAVALNQISIGVPDEIVHQTIVDRVAGGAGP